MWNPNSISLFTLIFSILASSGELLRPAFYSIALLKRFIHLKAFVLLAFASILSSYFLWFFNLYAGWIGYYSIHETIFIFLLSGILIYARFIEPHMVRVDVHQYRLNPDRRFAKPVKVALIADLHMVFSGHERQLKIIVKKLNEQQPDLVVVAGDWTYEPEDKLVQELSVLKDIKSSVYSVQGTMTKQYSRSAYSTIIKRCTSLQ